MNWCGVNAARDPGPYKHEAKRQLLSPEGLTLTHQKSVHLRKILLWIMTVSNVRFLGVQKGLHTEFNSKQALTRH